jgi:hypothetical protein
MVWRASWRTAETLRRSAIRPALSSGLACLGHSFTPVAVHGRCRSSAARGRKAETFSLDALPSRSIGQDGKPRGPLPPVTETQVGKRGARKSASTRESSWTAIYEVIF